MLNILFMSSALLLLPLSSKPKYKWLNMILALMLITLLSLPIAYSPLTNFSFWSHSSMTDSLSAPLILLTLWISALMIIASQNTLLTLNKPNKFTFLVLLLNLVLISTFSANNLMTFYILFEASLIPTLLLIMGWGYQPERLQAGMYLMMYTITASLPLLISLMFMYISMGHLSLSLIHAPSMIPESMISLWWLMSTAAFLVKMPLFTVHLWLPKAHVEAPVAGSMVLAAVLLKLGSYGLLRLASIFLWTNSALSAPIAAVAMWGACITGLICTRQTDMKSLIAYSSVGHMGLLVAGTMSNTSWGWAASLTMMIAHGLCSSALFSLANINYELTQTRSMYMTKGMMSLFPTMTMLWFMMSAANMAAPPSINLLGEIMLISSTTFISLIMVPSLLITGFIAAAYSLMLYTSSQHGWPPLFTSLGHLFNTRNKITTMLHLFPLILLITAPEFIVLWL